MPAKIRLARHGKKRFAFYHIVVADSRAPRDGKFIERIGTYNPNSNPATIDLDFDKALNWLQNGAQPTDTCRAILSYKGVLYKDHLLRGVKKGAFTIEVAEQKFSKWTSEKEGKILAKTEKLAAAKNMSKRDMLKAETTKKEEKAQLIAKKRTEALAKEREASIEETTSAE